MAVTSNHIPLVRLQHFRNYLNYLKEFETKAFRALEKEGLPRQIMSEQSGEYISTEWVLRAFSTVSQFMTREAIVTMHMVCARKAVLQQVSLIPHQGTVKSGLEALCRQAKFDSTDSEFVIEPGLTYHWYHRKRTNEAYGSDLLAILYMVYQTQLLLGENWYPKEVTIRASYGLGYDLAFKDQGIKVSTKERFTGIFIPDELLDREISVPALDNAQSNLEMVDSFRYSLKYLVKPFMCECVPTIQEAAGYSNMSVRTLQRRLDKEGVTYSDIISELQEELICDLLINTDLSIGSISKRAGYSVQGHMARAFRKTFFCSPREFREKYRVSK